MRTHNLFAGILMVGIPALFGCSGQVPDININVNDPAKKVDILVNGSLFTSYIYPDVVRKPVFWPVISPGGNAVTRTFPMGQKNGERVDHPHHVGNWLNYGDVNGIDFWNNSEAIPMEKRSGYGTIVHQSVEKAEGGKGQGTLVTTANWINSGDTVLLKERTTFVFSATRKIRIIDRTTELTACLDTVKFPDNKEGFFAIRVARELEIPSDQPSEMTDAHGVITKVAQMDNTGVTGNYRSSEGIEGEKVWGTRGRWMKLSGMIHNEKISVVIIDHPQNVGYPTYWHARGYGLFAANPLGQKIFSKGAKEMNFMLLKNERVVFRYRLVIASEDLSDKAINALADAFAKTQQE